MSILRRIRDMACASVNEVLDHLEDPVAMLNQYIRDIEQEISHAEITLARQVALEKKWSLQIEEVQDRIVKRNRQAELAVTHGEDDIARQAIQDRVRCEQQLEEYRAQYQLISTNNGELREQLQELKDKFYEMRNKRSYLISRANSAEVSKRMTQTLYSVDTETAAKGFARMEERIMMMEADAMASKNIRTTFGTPNTTMFSPAVEEELERLKSQKQIG